VPAAETAAGLTLADLDNQKSEFEARKRALQSDFDFRILSFESGGTFGKVS